MHGAFNESDEKAEVAGGVFPTTGKQNDNFQSSSYYKELYNYWND